MKTIAIVSWNVNGLRASLKKGFLEFVKRYNPDILCLQETKAERGQIAADLSGYEERWNSAKRRGYSGTAIFTKITPLSVETGFHGAPHLMDAQGRDAGEEGRVLTMEFDSFFLVNVYTPNSKEDLSRLGFRHKLWDPAFLAHLKRLERKKPVIACGDFNVAHEEIDLARPKENDGEHGFTKEEREGFSKLLAEGFIDTFRREHPGEPRHYTWWSPWAKSRERNIGWRIDYIIASKALAPRLEKSFILDKVHGSDHCPVGIGLLL